MCVFCDEDPKLVGEFFGYHKCCVEWFINQEPGDTSQFTYFQHRFHEMTEGIAFIPCPSHAEKVIVDGLRQAEMVSNRVCSTPFPYAGEADKAMEKEFKKWLKKKLRNK